MKTIEEKAKAYDEAIKRGLDYIRHTPATEMVTRQDIFEAIFPEFKEPKDEKIRKGIIELVKQSSEILDTQNQNNMLAWLEKQVEQKPAELAKGEDYGIDGLWHAQRILEKTFGKVDGYQTDDGILSHECAISAVKELYEQKPAWSREDEGFLDSALWHVKNSITNGKIKAFVECPLSTWLKSLKDRVQPKPKQEWSEEDECYMSECIGAIATKDGWSFEEKRKTKHWLKSIKDRALPQPKQEWSALDERNLQGVIDEVQANKNNAPNYDLETYDRFLSWLKSLKQRIGG